MFSPTWQRSEDEPSTGTQPCCDETFRSPQNRRELNFFLFFFRGKESKARQKLLFFVVVFVFPCPHAVVSIKEKSFKRLKMLKVDLVVTGKEPKNLLRDFFLTITLLNLFVLVVQTPGFFIF